MKKIISGILAILLTLGSIPMTGMIQAGADTIEDTRTVAHTLYVSPDGSDSNDGSAASPFKTIEKAKETVRTLDKSGGDIVVKIADGFYSLDDTLLFSEEDSGNENCTIYYEAKEGAVPIISGGDKLNGTWTLEDSQKNIWKIPLERENKLRSLYVNGERSYMANTNGTIGAKGSYGRYTVGPNYSDTDFKWKEIFSDDFSKRTVGDRIGLDDSTYELYAKSGNNSNSIVNVVDAGEGNKALQIAHTANEDCGFTVKCDTYENALIELDYQFAADHVFNNLYESLQLQGWYKDVDNWYSFVQEKDRSYTQSDQEGEVSSPIGEFPSSLQNGKWVSTKIMILNGNYFVKNWEKGTQEPKEWTCRNVMPVSGEGGRLRIYAYKGGNNSKVDIRIDNIKISAYDGKLGDQEAVEASDWAWATGTKFDGIRYSQSDLPEIRRNPEDVEIENQQVWNKNTVCVREIEDSGDGQWILKLQQPYGAIAQTPGWGVGLQGTGNHIIYNAYELLDKPGEFYFDKTEKMLYYIPRENEDLSSAEVVVPRLETILDYKGTPVASGDMNTAGRKEISGQVQYITMKGLTIAHSDWGLQKVGDSYGKSTVQAGTVYTAFSTDNWHYDMYRNLDTLPGAIQMEFAHHISILDGAIKLTGAEGVNMKNDVEDCEVTGCYFYQTGGSGVVVGNPQHIYENDSLEPEVYVHRVDQKPENEILGATADKEKYQNGLEAVPRNDRITNNLFYECSQLFPSNVTITSFYTQNLLVQNNILKNTAYSGMSIGWGWCNFDGKPDGFLDWGSANNQGGSVLPGYPTETCRENKILNNRIDDTMQILNDGGSIYTLGKQDGTQIEGNYLRNSEHTLYQDEGSAYFAPIKNNVSSGRISDAIYAGEYGRKHDLLYDNNYSTSNNCYTAEKESIHINNENFHYQSDGVWPLEAYEITVNSGLTKSYAHKYADLLSRFYNGVQNIVLPSSVGVDSSEELPIMGFLDPEDEIWLAPAGTKDFSENTYMTKARGDADTIALPQDSGEYKLYVKSSDGSVSGESQYTVFVTNTAPRFNTRTMSLYLGSKVYGQLTIENLPEGSEVKWDSSDPQIAVVDENGRIRAYSAGTATITAQIEGYTLSCVVTVKESAFVPADNLTMRFAADEGTTLGEDGSSVLEWADQSGSGVKLSQSNAAAPKLITDENGNKHLQFNGSSEFLAMNGVDFNNKEELTVILVNQYTGPVRQGDENGDRGTSFFVTEDGGWGSVYLSPYQDHVAFRFGSGAANCHVKYNREAEMETNSVTAAVKKRSTEQLYINGQSVLKKDGQADRTANNGSDLYVGASISNNQMFYFTGTVSEILVYDKALTDLEMEEVNAYLMGKYKIQVELESIKLNGPDKTEYEIGEELDTAGLTVTASYSNGTEAEVTNYEVSGYDSAQAGDKTVTISYTEGGITKTASFGVTVKEKEEPVVLESITLSGPQKIVYELNEALDTTGLVVTANYSDSSQKEVSDYELSEFDSSEAGQKTVTVSYTEGDVTKTADFTVTVNKAPDPETVTLTSITLTGPDKTSYEIGEELDTTGLTVTAHYSDDSAKEVQDYVISGFDSSAAGQKTVHVSYTEEEITKAASFTVTVNEKEPEPVILESVSLTGPDKTTYEIGEELDTAGLVVTAHYSDGNTKEVQGYEISGFDSTVAGKKTVVVSYTEGDATQTASFEVTVNEKAEPVILESITLTAPKKTEYAIGEAFDPDGLAVTAHYSDGSTREAADYEVNGFDSRTPGQKTVKVSYTEGGVTESASFTVVVKEKQITQLVDKEELLKLIQEAEKLKDGDYTDASWSALTAALSHAGSVFRESVSTQERVDEAIRNLKEKMDGLVRKSSAAVEVNIQDKMPQITIANQEEALRAILSDEEFRQISEGIGVRILLQLQAVDENRFAPEIQSMKNAFPGWSLGKLLNITLSKQIGSEEAITLNQTEKAIRFVIQIPEELKAGDAGTRTFSILRVHDGKVEELKDLDSSPDTITVESDKFSVYAIVYKDQQKEQEKEDNKTSQNSDGHSGNDSKASEVSTQDGAPIAGMLILAGGAAVAIFFSLRRKRVQNR